jgi:hypothetical protein
MINGALKMAKSKFSKYIVYAGKMLPPEPHRKVRTPGTELFYVHDGILPGAFMMTCTWQTGITPGTLEREFTQHYHDMDEYLGLIGSDMEHPLDLCGEAEFWFEDEKFVIDKSCLIFVPRGTRHAPLIVTRVDKPIFIFSTTPDTKHNVHECPEYMKKH